MTATTSSSQYPVGLTQNYQLIYTEPYVLCLEGWGKVGVGDFDPVSNFSVCVSRCISPEPWVSPNIA